MFALSQTKQHILIVIFIIVSAPFLSKNFKYHLKKYIDSQKNLLRSQRTNYNFFKRTISFVAFLLAAIVAVRILGYYESSINLREYI